MAWFRKASSSLAAAPSFAHDYAAEPTISVPHLHDLDRFRRQDLTAVVAAELRATSGHTITEHLGSTPSVPVVCVWLQEPLPADFMPCRLRSELQEIGSVLVRCMDDSGLTVLLAAHHPDVDPEANLSPLAVLTYNLTLSEHFSVSNMIVNAINKQFRKEVPVPTFYLDAGTREIFHVHQTSLELYGDSYVSSAGPEEHSSPALVSTNRQRVVALAIGFIALALTLVAVLLSDRFIATCLSGASVILALLAIKLLHKSSAPNHPISS